MHIDKDIYNAIVITWNNIAPDAEEMCEDDNYIAMEVTLDADRMAMCGFEEEQKELDKLYDEYGYVKVWEFLSKNIQLI
jgi:hypothetical protein